jgi:hypothetical protein
MSSNSVASQRDQQIRVGSIPNFDASCGTKPTKFSADSSSCSVILLALAQPTSDTYFQGLKLEAAMMQCQKHNLTPLVGHICLILVYVLYISLSVFEKNTSIYIVKLHLSIYLPTYLSIYRSIYLSRPTMYISKARYLEVHVCIYI